MKPNSTLSPRRNYSKRLDQRYEISCFRCFMKRGMKPSLWSSQLCLDLANLCVNIYLHWHANTCVYLTPKSIALVNIYFGCCGTLLSLTKKLVICNILKEHIKLNVNRLIICSHLQCDCLLDNCKPGICRKTLIFKCQSLTCTHSSTLFPISLFLTVEWQRKPNTTMTMAGVKMVPNTRPARQALMVAIIRFWAVTSTEQAQQSRDPRSSRGASLPPPPISAAE